MYILYMSYTIYMHIYLQYIVYINKCTNMYYNNNSIARFVAAGLLFVRVMYTWLCCL